MDQDQVRKHQKKFLQTLKSRTKPTHIKLQNVDILINPDVFPPATDTALLAEYIKVMPGEKILDLTTGSGAIALIAGIKGAEGFAVDINPAAIKNAKDNFEKYKVAIKPIESDLFQNIPKEQFDVIYVNGPYIDGEITDPLEYAFFGAKSFFTRLFSQVANYIKKNGYILITFAEWGDISFFENTIKNNNLNFEIIAKKTSSDGERTYRLYKITKD